MPDGTYNSVYAHVFHSVVNPFIGDEGLITELSRRTRHAMRDSPTGYPMLWSNIRGDMALHPTVAMIRRSVIRNAEEVIREEIKKGN